MIAIKPPLRLPLPSPSFQGAPYDGDGVISPQARGGRALGPVGLELSEPLGPLDDFHPCHAHAGPGTESRWYSAMTSIRPTMFALNSGRSSAGIQYSRMVRPPA